MGYYAKDKQGNLLQFEWKSNDTFTVLKDYSYIEADVVDYEIVQVEEVTYKND